mmetsp:Transcript_42609/g.129356  ORF Transcript_42609/g.129356 Transcript_42609/m.129356 type:complete len:283 (-) Transcript_42609:631-1479(-)
MKVRGPAYFDHGIKVPSDESPFALLGVDSVASPTSSAARADNGGGGCDADYDDDDDDPARDFLRRWRRAWDDAGGSAPFLLVINFVVPWGNLLAYFRRRGSGGAVAAEEEEDDPPAERAWRLFLKGDETYRNERLKLVPRIVQGSWMVKKAVGSSPTLIGKKIPMTYRGSVDANYLEIRMDVTRGSSLATSICSTVASKSDAVTVDLGFLVEGTRGTAAVAEEGEDGGEEWEEDLLPERVLCAFRLHHVSVKDSMTLRQWREELEERRPRKEDGERWEGSSR